MTPETILITGATGSLGAYLTRYYSRLGYDVIAQGRAKNPPENLLNYARYVQFDLTKDFELPPCDICIHTAAVSDDKATLPELLPANEEGTAKLVSQLKKETVYIHISSSSVYLPADKPITEEQAGNQAGKLSPYGLSKFRAEQQVIKHVQNTRTFILRPRAFYGAGDCVILPRILKLVKTGSGEQLNRPGKMEVSVSMTHYSTIAHAIDCCLKNGSAGLHIYNVADKSTYRLIDIVRKITAAIWEKELKEKEIPIGFMKLLSWFKIGGITPLLVRSFTKNMVLDTAKIERELNYQPAVTFDDQLEELANWVKTQGGATNMKEVNRYLSWTDDL